MKCPHGAQKPCFEKVCSDYSPEVGFSTAMFREPAKLTRNGLTGNLEGRPRGGRAASRP
jgi:hypothetical protein